MFTKIVKLRKRVTYVHIGMMLALVLAMSGGAYAAKRYLITSTKQIKPSVLTQLKGAKGPAGPAGPSGSTGLMGATGLTGATGIIGKEGPQGKAGVEGKEGKAGVEGKEGKAGVEGKEGSPWTAGGTLPKGATETGTWTAKPGAGETQLVSIGFPIPLAAELEASAVHIAPDATCPGTAAAPAAEKGVLCVYIGVNLNQHVELSGTFKPSSLSPGAGVAGAILNTKGIESPTLAYGTWAVTG
jgi:hypothetical protein